MVKNPPTVQETWVQFLGQEDPLEKGMAIHSSILAWRIPWTEEPQYWQKEEIHKLRWVEGTQNFHALWVSHPPSNLEALWTRSLGLFYGGFITEARLVINSTSSPSSPWRSGSGTESHNDHLVGFPGNRSPSSGSWERQLPVISLFSVAKSWLFCHFIDYSLLGSSVHGIS